MRHGSEEQAFCDVGGFCHFFGFGQFRLTCFAFGNILHHANHTGKAVFRIAVILTKGRQPARFTIF